MKNESDIERSKLIRTWWGHFYLSWTELTNLSLFLCCCQNNNTNMEDKKHLFWDNHVLFTAPSPSSSLSLWPFCANSLLHQSITKSRNPANLHRLASRQAENVGQVLPPGDAIHFKTKCIIYVWNLWTEAPWAARRLESTEKRTNRCFFSPTDKLINQSGPLANTQQQLQLRVNGMILKLKKKERNGLPATPKGRRRPEVSFLVLLSLSSMRPTRTIDPDASM